MRRAGWSFIVGGLLVLALAAVVPVGGRGIGVNRVDVTCGPALGAALRRTGPDAEPGADPTVMTSSDTGLSAAAWCQGAAARWLRPGLVLGVLAVAGGSVLLVAASRRSEASVAPEVVSAPG